MGWKVSCIFIQSEKNHSKNEICTALSLEQMKSVSPEPFEVACNPPDKAHYIGYLNGCYVLCHPFLPAQILAGNKNVDALLALFPHSKILVTLLISSVNAYGYALYENSQLIRKKYGDSDEPIREEIGALLAIEQVFFDTKIDRVVQGEFGTEYFFKDDMEISYADDQIGEELVSVVCKEVMGEELFDMNDTAFFETKLEGFSISNIRQGKGAKRVEIETPAWKRHLLTIIMTIIVVIVLRMLWLRNSK